FAEGLSDASAGYFVSGLSREELASVDETGVVSRVLSDRKGRTHVMLDIGAHHGSSARYFDDLDWTIHCFEPDPSNRAKLAKAFGAAPNVTIDPRAVSDAPAQGVAFFQSQESTGISGLHAFRDTHAETGRVDVTTVAEIVADLSLAHVDFLKIDVEGFDFSVLKGVPWDTLRPDVIECEFEDAKTKTMGHTWRDIAAYLEERGYSVYVSEWHPIIRYGVRHDWRRVSRYIDADIPADAWGNLLAFRKDPGLPTLRAAFRASLNRAEAAKSAAPERIKAAAGRSDTTAMKRRFYSPMANWLKLRAPAVFTLLRFVKKTLGGLWRRRLVTAPAALFLVALLAASFAPALSAYQALIWIGAAFTVVFAAIAYIAMRLRQFTEALAAENALLRQNLSVARNAIRRTDQKLADFSKASSQTAKKNAAALQAAQDKLAKTESRALQSEKRLTATETALAAASAEIGALRSRTEKAVATAQSEAKRIEMESGKRTEALSAQLSAVAGMAAQTERSAVFNNAIWYQRFNRRLNQDHIDTLMANWSEALPFKLTRHALGYLADRACHIEASMQGRLATTIEDILLRSLAALGAKGRDIEVMEIGTLFGIGAGIMYDALAPHFDSVRMTLLDPLDGYYESKRLDILTGQPVTESILRSNLDRVSLNGDRLRLIKHLSTDSEALVLASERRYDVIVIDGDHTYDGVKADFDLYAPLVKPEGLIIFDDYGSEHWPDVQKYVDAEVEGLEFVERVGIDWRTCIYRVNKQR
ncbi:MAG: FkbM family methyltransferase, partial [Amphiplicatus sp.]